MREHTDSTVHNSTIVAPGQSCFDAYPRLSVPLGPARTGRGALPLYQTDETVQCVRPQGANLRHACCSDLVESSLTGASLSIISTVVMILLLVLVRSSARARPVGCLACRTQKSVLAVWTLSRSLTCHRR